MDKLKFYVEKLCNHKKFALLICFISGAAGTIPYYCEGLFIFTFISLFAQFYIAITQRRVHGRVFLPFFMYFLGFCSPLYIFLAELYPYERFGFSGMQAIFILVCSCILIPLFHALIEGAIMYISKILPDGKFSPLGYASLWVIGEWVLTLGTLAFPWGNIAVSLTGFLPYLQTASLFGKYFISFITVFACCSFAVSAQSRKRFFALIGACIIACNTVVGTAMWFIPTEKSEVTETAVIQGNVLSNEKWATSNRREIFYKYTALTEEAAKNGAELIVLPESAIPIAFTAGGQIHDALADIASEYGVTIVSGVNYYQLGEQYNSVIAVLPDGSLSEKYDKRHLVPFGEFIPFSDVLGKLIPFIGEFSADSGSYTEGTEPVVIETPSGNIAPLVCFDSIFSQFAAEGVDNGGEMIAVVTNDSWFNDSVGIYTHLRHAQIRAIENGRYVIRAANTGVSAFINEQGKIMAQSEPLTVDTIYGSAATIQNNTLYSYLGNAVLYISIIIVIVLITYNIRRTRDGKNTASQDRDL